MKLIIEADDVGKEIDFLLMSKMLDFVGSVQHVTPVIDFDKALQSHKKQHLAHQESEMTYGKTLSGATVSVVNGNGKRKYTKSSKFVKAMRERAKKKSK